MEREVLEKNIYYYKNIIDNPGKLVDAIEKTESQNYDNLISKWQSWNSYDGQPYNYGTQKTVFPVGIKKFNYDNDENINYIFMTISNAFHEAAKDYSSSLFDGRPPHMFLRFDIKKYKSGAHMGTHPDQVDGDQKKYSLVLYINDEYEGGEISFQINNEENKNSNPDYDSMNTDNIVGIKPEAGSIVMFPSTYHHTGHIVKTGYKYMITVFCTY